MVSLNTSAIRPQSRNAQKSVGIRRDGRTSLVHFRAMSAVKTSTTVTNDIVMGAGLMVTFSLIAPIQDTLAKLATDYVSSGLISFARFAIQTAILLPIILLRFGPSKLWPSRVPHLHAARGVLMAIVTVLFTVALESMYVADAIAIFFVEPMFLTVLGGMILRERVGWRRYVACAVGFVGAMFVIQPSFEELASDYMTAISRVFPMSGMPGSVG